MTRVYEEGVWIRRHGGELELVSETEFSSLDFASSYPELAQRLKLPFPSYDELLVKRGWTRTSSNDDSLDEWHFQLKRGEIIRLERDGRDKIASQRLEKWLIVDGSNNVIRTWEWFQRGRNWLDADHHGRVLIGDAGCLYVWNDVTIEQPVLVADLNDNSFEEMVAPQSALLW
ncbi:MAG: hypothetical protein M3R13_05730 [Armatimonadota bacterium]|nr:hypothetical protein [Armatimonadota bacterium]